MSILSPPPVGVELKIFHFLSFFAANFHFHEGNIISSNSSSVTCDRTVEISIREFREILLRSFQRPIETRPRGNSSSSSRGTQLCAINYLKSFLKGEISSMNWSHHSPPPLFLPPRNSVRRTLLKRWWKAGEGREGSRCEGKREEERERGTWVERVGGKSAREITSRRVSNYVDRSGRIVEITH